MADSKFNYHHFKKNSIMRIIQNNIVLYWFTKRGNVLVLHALQYVIN